MSDVPRSVLADLAKGVCETVNLMEWLATDMSVLAVEVASLAPSDALRRALTELSPELHGLGITQRLTAAGARVAPHMASDKSAYEFLAGHRSDIVRQWACYGVNQGVWPGSSASRLKRTLRFATDQNMSVRETAWMAFRPHLFQLPVDGALALLEPLTRSDEPNVRRFAIEVSRPRSVWGAHFDALKRDPNKALQLLDNVRSDSSRYVQLATGNWLNDASKSRPDWVQGVCERWAIGASDETGFVIRRGLRTIAKKASEQHKEVLL